MCYQIGNFNRCGQLIMAYERHLMFFSLFYFLALILDAKRLPPLEGHGGICTFLEWNLT